MSHKILAILFVIFLGAAINKCAKGSETKPIEEIILTKENSTALTGDVDYNSTSKIMNDIENRDILKPFYLYIYSPGGDILTSFPLLNLLRKSNVICITELGISMAFSITEACPTRLIIETSIMMQHQAGASVTGDTSKIRVEALIIQKFQLNLHKLDASRLQIDFNEFEKNIHDQWWMIGAQDILDNKAADRIVSVSCSPEYNKSGCPIGKLN